MVDRAGAFYKENPKLVGGLALLAAAALWVGIRQGRRPSA